MKRHLGDLEPGRGSPPGLRDRLLVSASEAGVPLKDLLGRALEEALDVGAAEAGALFLFDPAEPERCTVAWATRGSNGLPPRQLAPRLMEDGAERLFQMSRTGRPVRVHREERPADEPVLMPESREALWVPLLDRSHLVGVMLLETTRAGSFGPSRIRGLELLGRAALPGLQRGFLLERLRGMGGPGEMLGRSPVFLDLESQVRLAGCFSDGPVLITGERGSGKELVAWAIHGWSRRRERPFVPMLASTLNDNLVADELFGHERHSFTGAEAARSGRLKAADGGTLFLDEVSDLPVPVQTAFLRVLERGEIQRIGADQPLHVDVRVVAATNSDLGGLMASGHFRRDLHDRLAFFQLRVPPLRERREDIPLLAVHFLQHFCQPSWRHSIHEREGTCTDCRGGDPPCVTDGFLQALQEYPWPGNIRELKHTMAQIVATTPDEDLDVHHLPAEMRGRRAGLPVSPPCGPDVAGDESRCDVSSCPGFAGGSNGSPRNAGAAGSGAGGERPQGPVRTLEQVIRDHIRAVLEKTGYNQSEAARLLGLPLSTLRSKMKRAGITLPSQS